MKIRMLYFYVIAILLVAFLLFSLGIPRRINAFFLKNTSVKKEGRTADAEIKPENIYKWLDFSKKGGLEGWKNKIFKGKTKYWIEKSGEESYLHSKSDNSASALYKMVTYNIRDFPVLSWRWRPVKFPRKQGIEDSERKDDYALRLYVVFASGFFTNFTCVEYVWDESINEGTKMESPFSEKIMQLVIRSGKGDNNWVLEERNVSDDYISLFGKKPKSKVRAIAIMTDSEGAHDSAEAHFKDILIIKKL